MSRRVAPRRSPGDHRSGRSRVRTGRLVLGVVAVALAVGGLWVTTHGVAGVAVADVVSVLHDVPLRRLGLLAVIWMGGLAVYATVLSAALPGLGVRRGLLLNLSGSAVANVVPLGGAAATALNWRMVRGWGHSDPEFATYCLLTNALDVATKLVLPLVAVGVSVALSTHVPVALWEVAGACAAVLVAAAGLAARLVRGSSTGPPVRAAGHPFLRWLGRAARALRDALARVVDALARAWPRLVPASVGYVATQVALLDVSLHSVGLGVTVPVVLSAAAIERLGTLVPITPGGTGVAEVGTVAWLVASGSDPAQVVAGVLLYRVFLIGMEVPVGGALLGAWSWWTSARGPGARVTA